MDRDLTIMIYGAIMGVVGSVLTSLVSALFQLWLERREYDRRQSEQQRKQLKHIHIPTDEEVISINSGQYAGHPTEPQHKAAEAGSILLSVVLGSLLVYQTNDPMLGFTFTAMLGFFITNRIIKFLRR